MANQEENKDSSTISRRKFLANSGYAIGGLVVGGVLGSLLGREPKQQTPAPNQSAPQQTPDFNQALMFFTQEQFKVVDAATERIFPKDDNGPGARDLGVAFFIDHQLAGEYGFNARDYMQPPFFPGEKVQGYQGRLRRREIYEIGLREMQNYSMSKYKKNFYDLAPEEQDAVLTAFEKDEIKLTTTSASGFFKMLVTNTLEGVYADPLYGGNKNMSGWNLKKYPGNQMSYANIIEKEGLPQIKPASLRDHLSH
ncbi:gluconate 2-dehydrogenase subunit 3 family protein [Brevibacillus fulvus]|uniref:Gluconate 2-dehydrogenase gamma chain n=1 Tax=Brevibacillus fulvus TaxID=1125967 RepID=A0A938XZN9_9BACL|nr:gluconate 2-dehydrogenase subunit 3 family protein [Brevibacillus fulvus]MBM7589371.1 gluconate 2-dehydrogenase gamma chain [Brevibacillus fulvus]